MKRKGEGKAKGSKGSRDQRIKGSTASPPEADTAVKEGSRVNGGTMKDSFLDFMTSGRTEERQNGGTAFA